MAVGVTYPGWVFKMRVQRCQDKDAYDIIVRGLNELVGIRETVTSISRDDYLAAKKTGNYSYIVILVNRLKNDTYRMANP